MATFLAQLSPEIASGWDKVGIVGLLSVALGSVVLAFTRGWVVSKETYRAKYDECEAWRKKAEDAEQHYADLLKETIEEWKQRDKTIELLSQVAAGGPRGDSNV